MGNVHHETPAREEHFAHLPEEARRFIALRPAETTRRMYRSDLLDLERFVHGRGKRLAQATEEDAAAWVADLARRPVQGHRGLDPITIARKVSVARSFFAHLQAESGEGRGRKNPFARVEAPRVSRARGRTPYVAKREVELLLGTFDPGAPRGLRDLAIATLLFANGLRVSEVAALRRSQVALEEGHRVIELSGKGGSRTKTTLRPEVWKLLQLHIAKNVPHGEYVFRAMPRNPKYFEGKGKDPRTHPISSRAIEKILKSAAREARLDPRRVRPHAGRVFFVTEAYEATGDLERVSRGVGHEDLGTTRGYLRYLDTASKHPALALPALVPKRSAP